MTIEEFAEALHAPARVEHEAFMAKVRGWAELAEAEGRTADARRHREHIARLDAIPKPWDRKAA